MNALAFDTRLTGTKLRAIFSSDIGHWDVPEMQEVLPEAWELVEKGLLDEAAFRDFVFATPARLWNATQRKGLTLVPLVLYFNHRGMAKIKIGVAKGKKLHDKRETAAKRDWSRQKSRLMKDHG